jgi:hypothetical protein
VAIPAARPTRLRRIIRRVRVCRVVIVRLRG